MKYYREVSIKSKSLSELKIIETIKCFCQNNDYWAYLSSKSKNTTEHLRKPACVVSFDGKKNAVIVFVKKSEKTLYISYRKAKTIDEFNEIAHKFVVDFRKFIKKHRYPVDILEGKDQLGIESIIRSKKAREYWEKYVDIYSPSYNDFDIDHLDKFTCALSRYSRKNINFAHFEKYLIEDLNWNEEDAIWCRRRVQIGYEVLQIKKRPY